MINNNSMCKIRRKTETKSPNNLIIESDEIEITGPGLYECQELYFAIKNGVPAEFEDVSSFEEGAHYIQSGTGDPGPWFCVTSGKVVVFKHIAKKFKVQFNADSPSLQRFTKVLEK